MKQQFNKLDFSPLIDKIIELDNNPDLYKRMLKESWFIDNAPPIYTSTRNQWKKIFDSL